MLFYVRNQTVAAPFIYPKFLWIPESFQIQHFFGPNMFWTKIIFGPAIFEPTIFREWGGRGIFLKKLFNNEKLKKNCSKFLCLILIQHIFNVYELSNMCVLFTLFGFVKSYFLVVRKNYQRSTLLPPSVKMINFFKCSENIQNALKHEKN